MECNFLIDNLITIIILVIFGLLWRYYIPSFLSEKAKNLATNQDIEKITEKVETIKSEFTSQTEILKADLQVLMNYQIQYRSEERAAIIEFHNDFNKWISTCWHIDVTDYSRGNPDDLLLKRKEIHAYLQKANLSMSKLNLLVQDASLTELASQLLIEGIAFSNWVEYFLVDLNFSFTSQNNLVNKFLRLEIHKNYELYKDIAHSLANEEEVKERKSKELIQGFLKNKMEKYNPIIKLQAQFNKQAKEYLLNN